MQTRTLFLAATLLITLPCAALACPPEAHAASTQHMVQARAPAPSMAPAGTINFKMTREQCRHLSKADGYTPDEFAARSIWCDKSYASDNFKDEEHPIDDGMTSMAPAAGNMMAPIE